MDLDDLVRAVSAYASSTEAIEYWSERDPAIARSLPLLAAALAERPALARRAIELEKERVTGLAAFGPACEFFFAEEMEFDEKAVMKWAGQAHVPEMFGAFISHLAELDSLDEAGFEAMAKGWAEANGFDKLGPVVHPTRVALTGRTVGPGLWELMAALGPAMTAERLRKGIEVLR
jgi:glutamyl-tRNA synthetase